MNDQTDDRPLKAQSLDEKFKRRSRRPCRNAADGRLSRGLSVSYREPDTPAGHVLRRHPDGRTETVRVDLGAPPDADRQSTGI